MLLVYVIVLQEHIILQFMMVSITSKKRELNGQDEILSWTSTNYFKL